MSEIDSCPKTVSQEEASEILGVSIGTLAVWRSTKRYPLNYVKVGARVRYRHADLKEFLDLRARGGIQPVSPKRSRRDRRRV